MFKMFGKKKEEPPPLSQDARPELESLAAQYAADEFNILGVTGPEGIQSRNGPDGTPVAAGIMLTAWMEEDGEEIHRQPTRLVAMADEKLVAYLRRRVPKDFILNVRVRPSLDGSSLLMTDLPQPGFDPELKAILEEQKKPMSTAVPGLGNFTLNRALGWFEMSLNWLGTEISLTFDKTEDPAACSSAALTILEAKEAWDRRVREFAAGQLLEQTKDWSEETETPLTDEEFQRRLEPESLQIWGDGRFDFWFHDADFCWGRAVCIAGTTIQGPTEARMEE